MSIYLLHKRVKGGLINDTKKEYVPFSCAHTSYVCMCVHIIVSHLPCGHLEQHSKAMSKSWQENMELLSPARQGQPAQERHSSRVKQSIEIKCAVKRSQTT